MSPDKKCILWGKKIEQYYWTGKNVVYIDNRLTDMTYEQACMSVEANHFNRKMNVVQQTLNAPASTESTPQIICEKTACNCHSIDKKNRCLQYTDYGVDSCSFRK